MNQDFTDTRDTLLAILKTSVEDNKQQVIDDNDFKAASFDDFHIASPDAIISSDKNVSISAKEEQKVNTLLSGVTNDTLYQQLSKNWVVKKLF